MSEITLVLESTNYSGDRPVTKRRVLTSEEYNALYVALQWPEERAAAARVMTPTNMGTLLPDNNGI